MFRKLAKIVLATAVMGAGSAAMTASAQAAFICKTKAVTGVASATKRKGPGRREARRAWEAQAKADFGFRYQWGLAVEKGAQPQYTTKRGRYYYTATGYPCRFTRKDGILLVNATESQKVCAGRPGLSKAQANGCKEFYILRK